MQDRQELIDIQAVADSFGKSVESIRKYKNFGIIRVSDKRGNKDLFDREEIMSIRDRLRDLRLKGLSLAQIANELDIARDEHLSLPSPPTSMSGQTPHHEPGRPLKILVVDDEKRREHKSARTEDSFELGEEMHNVFLKHVGEH
jgi:DNA-binding transcriptional MerR regulator